MFDLPENRNPTVGKYDENELRSPVVTGDPYRVVFERMSAGAARCRARRDGSTIRVEVIEQNLAFAAMRSQLPALYEAIARVQESGQAEIVSLHRGASLSCSLFPAGPDEVVVVIEQNRFELAFHGNAAAMVIAHQHDLRIIDLNQRCLEMFGVTREEIIGRTPSSMGLLSEADAKNRIAMHRQSDGGWDMEQVVRTRAGARLTVLASARPIQLPEGPCTLTTLIDISDRKHAEEAFSLAFSASPAGMMLVNASDDTIVAANQRMLDMTHYAREDLVGKHMSAFTVLAPTREELLAEVARAGRLREVEVQIGRRDGSGVWTLASTEAVRLHDVVHRLSVFTEITDRKQLERRLLTQHEIGRLLAEARDSSVLPQILEALCRGEVWDCAALWLPDASGTLVCQGTWHYLGAMPLFESAMYGLVPSETGGVIAHVLATGELEAHALATLPHPFAVQAYAMGLHSLVVFPILRGSDVLGVALMAARDERAMLDGADPRLLESVGRMIGMFVERTRAEAKLRQLNIELEDRIDARTQELESSNRDLEAFSSSVSHDLRAPLRAIQGFSQVMLEDYGELLPEEAKATLGRIHASGVRLRMLIDQLLSFARLGRGRLNRETVDLDAMVRSVLDELVAHRDLGDKLAMELQPLGTCNADPTLLRAVWTNLLDNALKYSRDRDPIRIEVGREQRGDTTVYFVRDNGVGFDMAQADRLFGVFQRLHAASEFEGTGVGLANVRRVIERHRGTVGATSVIGEGSRFEFTLGND